MKFSNLILTFILALFASFSIHSQSNSTHVISIHNDDEDIHIEYTDGEVSVLKIDGVTISKSDYPDYQHLLNKHKKRSKSGHYTTDDSNKRNDMQSILLEKIIAYLSEDDNFNRNNFEFKLTSKKMYVNGKKLSKSKLIDCLEIFDETAGYSLSRGSYFKVDIAPGTRSVSLSILE